MGGVFNGSPMQVVSYFQSAFQLAHGQECLVIELQTCCRIRVPRHFLRVLSSVVLVWNAKRMTLICPYTSLGGRQPSKWEFPFSPKVNP